MRSTMARRIAGVSCIQSPAYWLNMYSPMSFITWMPFTWG